MPLSGVQLDTDRITARRVLHLQQAGRIHHESREAARDEVWRHGAPQAGDPIFVGITNRRRHVRVLCDVEVYSDTAP